MQDADAALAGHRDGHPGLGDGVHRRGHQRDAQGDLPRQPGRRVDLGGDDVGLPRQEQDVVVGETGLDDERVTHRNKLPVPRAGSCCRTG